MENLAPFGVDMFLSAWNYLRLWREFSVVNTGFRVHWCTKMWCNIFVVDRKAHAPWRRKERCITGRRNN